MIALASIPNSMHHLIHSFHTDDKGPEHEWNLDQVETKTNKRIIRYSPYSSDNIYEKLSFTDQSLLMSILYAVFFRK